MKKIENILVTIGVILIAWVFLSFCDINAHNHDENPQYNEYNFFTIIMGGDE